MRSTIRSDARKGAQLSSLPHRFDAAVQLSASITDRLRLHRFGLHALQVKAARRVAPTTRVIRQRNGGVDEELLPNLRASVGQPAEPAETANLDPNLSMSEPSSSPPEEISLLDFLVVVAQSWILLLIAPIVIGLLVFGLLRLQPQSYSSSATLLIQPSAAWSPAVANAIPDTTMQSALDRVAVAGIEIKPAMLIPSFVPATAPSGWGTQTLTLSGSDSSKIQPSLSALAHEIDTQLKATATAAANGQIEIANEGIASRRAALAQLQERMKELTGADAQTWAAAIDALVTEIGVQSARKLELQQTLANQPGSFILRPATAARLAPGRDPKVLGIVAALGVEFLMLVFVFARAGMRKRIEDPQQAEKLARIKRSFGLGRRRQAEQAKS